ncbi:MAG TPA: DEAD/DEAH box helicase family protein [Clostridia bacterium]|nr:DEAD/DEAH box helicase family protein [Clostridia bacterium]
MEIRLFPIWFGLITIPESPFRNEKIAQHRVSQQAFRGAITNAEIIATDNRGVYMIKTDLAYPFNEILLNRNRTRLSKSLGLVLKAPKLEKISDLDRNTSLEWEDCSLLTNELAKPSKVLENWKGKFSFREEDVESGQNGLRAPQLGALHALSAHFAVGQNFEPATVILPTGTGKTETMLSLQVYKRLPLTLVVVPSDALRTQMFRKFIVLGVLSKINVIPKETICPNVLKLSSGIRSVEEARAIASKTNIIVTIPNTLNSSDPEGLKYLIDQCTDLIVDEAHHIPATQWSNLQKMFLNKRIIQFTATPFRRDNKRIEGKIIYNYFLGEAQKDGYYSAIKLKTVEEYGDLEKRDRQIAQEAIKALRRDRNELHLDHVLMARCESKERAIKVFKIYEDLAPEMIPQLVYSGQNRKRENEAALERISNRVKRISNIIVCVDMLGEGFDLPNLKIAALHDTHKSLAITLQFIGRFTRESFSNQIGAATVVVNIADPDTEKKLEELYAEDADWDAIISRLSNERINQELSLQKIVYDLRDSGDLHTQISLWNLRPSLSTQIFKTFCTDWTPEQYKELLPRDSKSWYSLSNDRRLLVAVIYRKIPVHWGNYQDLLDLQYDLLILRWDEDNKVLFLYSSDYDGIKSETLAKLVTDENTLLLQGAVVFKILNNVELPLVKNLGSSKIGAISFTSYFGPNVTDGLALIEKAESTLNNIACVGYEDGERVLWGATQKRGKIWQQSAGTISQWIEWTNHTWKKVTSDDESEEKNITRGFLRPVRLKTPHNSYPIGIQWGEQVQSSISDRLCILFGSLEVPLYLTDLAISNVEKNGDVDISISCEEISSLVRFVISEISQQGFLYKKLSGPDVSFVKANGVKISLDEYFVIDPPIIRYADGTYSYNCYHIPTNINAGELPKDQIEVWDFSIISLNRESLGKSHDTNTIQYMCFQKVADEYDVVFNDDGCGEAGDLVCLKEEDGQTIKLCLVHCKGAINGKISSDIRNFYTLCGQAQKSITIKHLGLPHLYRDLKHRNEIWEKEGASRFLKGTIKELSYFKEKSRSSKIQFEVVIVQPGCSISSISSDILKLLGTTELFIKTTTQGMFRVVVSE